MSTVRWILNKAGLRSLQDQLSDGFEAVADAVLEGAIARAPIGPSRQTRDSLHTVKRHSREWPKPAVFVATASGDGFFVHEGTVDTPPHPFLSDALDAVTRDIPRIIRSETKGKEFGIHRT